MMRCSEERDSTKEAQQPIVRAHFDFDMDVLRIPRPESERADECIASVAREVIRR